MQKFYKVSSRKGLVPIGVAPFSQALESSIVFLEPMKVTGDVENIGLLFALFVQFLSIMAYEG